MKAISRMDTGIKLEETHDGLGSSRPLLCRIDRERASGVLTVEWGAEHDADVQQDDVVVASVRWRVRSLGGGARRGCSGAGGFVPDVLCGGLKRFVPRRAWLVALLAAAVCGAVALWMVVAGVEPRRAGAASGGVDRPCRSPEELRFCEQLELGFGFGGADDRAWCSGRDRVDGVVGQ